jgi:zinc D-Ala-D-Ala dipeptidase
MKKNLVLIALTSFYGLGICLAISEEARSKGFVYLSEIDPSIIVSLRYATTENFVGMPVNGYKKAVCMLTKQAAEALKKVQEDVKKDGYCLVVYDAYRPQQAVDHFISWSTDLKDQHKKDRYYPRVDKDKVFELGYVDKRSGHSRGSTVDLTLIKAGKSPCTISEKKRVLADGYTVKLLDDGTRDMGASFDLFDTASHSENNLIDDKYKVRRAYLKKIMEKNGFKNYPKEWWHFTLLGEPYPADQESSYFNFPIE